MTAELAIPKVGKSVEIEIDGATVELRRISPRMYDWNPPHPMEQALLEIWIAGQHVGHASRPHGFGRQSFSIAALWRAHRDGWPEEVRYGRGHLSADKRLYTPDQIARKAAELRGAILYGLDRKQLMTLDEIEASSRAYRIEEARRDEEAKERNRQWDRERAQAKARAIEHRDEVLAGLRDLHDRADLSNLERAALVAAIARYEADRS